MGDWGKTKDGAKVTEFELDNGNGLTAKVLDYGATITELSAPDRNQQSADIVLGFDKLKDYEEKSPYFGVPVGRYANRIAHGKFELDGKSYQLAKNNEPGGVPCHLHGGIKGFDKVMWDAKPQDTEFGPSLVLHYTSKDGEEGYPGTLSVTLTYTLTYAGALRVEFQATTDMPTILNLAQHSYFNLGGHNSGDILDHRLTLFSDYYTRVEKDMIPTGEIHPVAHTPLDFRRTKKIGRDIEKQFDQLQFGEGFDHNWVIRQPYGQFRPAARLVHDASGREMEVWTDLPGIQFYAGNQLDGSLKGKGGAIYPKRGGLCLETQHFPDSPNHPDFPSTVLRPNETFETVTEYRFGIHV